MLQTTIVRSGISDELSNSAVSTGTNALGVSITDMVLVTNLLIPHRVGSESRVRENVGAESGK